ncbi:hypothetical protein JCM8547_000805 [Rhodosporidiobolus lusitaniae]
MAYAPSSSAQRLQVQSSVKSGQIAALVQSLQTLAERTRDLEQLSATTSEQASYMRLLGGHHAAWFMASQRIMTPGDAVDDTAQQQ